MLMFDIKQRRLAEEYVFDLMSGITKYYWQLLQCLQLDCRNMNAEKINL